jgi:OmpA-OmpF porin, OOP family
MHPKQVILAAATALLAIPALAQNAYFELGAGRSDASVDCTGTTSCDDSDSFVRAIAGYQFAPNWALEFSLAQLGRIKATAFVPGIGTVEASARLRSVGLGVAGSWPLADALSFTARLGVASNRTTISGSAGGLGGSDGENNAAPYAGLALGYAFTPAWTASLTLDRTQAEYQGDKATVSTAGVALRYRF